MRSQTKVFILLAGVCMLALSANAKQVHFLSTEAEEAIASTVSATSTYSVTVNYGEDFEEECVLGDSDDEADGLLFNDYDVTNLCLYYSSSNDQVYVVAKNSNDKNTKLIKGGSFDYSYRLRYVVSEETVYVQRTEEEDDASSSFTVDAQSYYESYTLTALLTAEDDYEEVIDAYGSDDYTFYPYITRWAESNYDEYEISVKVSQGASRCMVANGGLLSDTKICVEYEDDGTVYVTAANIFINQSEPLIDVDKIKATYNNYRNFLTVTNADTGSSGDFLFYIPSIDFRYMLDEGEINGGDGGSVALRVDNTMRNPYGCLTFNTDLLDASVLYPSIETVCVFCERYDLYIFDCEVQFKVEENTEFSLFHNLTFEGEIFMYEQGIEISYDLDTDRMTFDFWTNDKGYHPQHVDRMRFYKYADEIVEFGYMADDWIETSLNRPYLLENRIQLGYNALNQFYTVAALQFIQEFHQNYGLACNEYRCVLGFLNETNFEAVKVYEGLFTDWQVYSFQEDSAYGIRDPGAMELICLSFQNYMDGGAAESQAKGYNDCATRDQWVMYERVIYQYPIYDGEVSGLATDPTIFEY